MLKYQVKLSDYQIKDLSDDSLDPAFVAKAKELEEKITNKSLSDDEIAVIDEELCTLFEELHNFEDVPDEELTELQTQNTILKGKQAATEATTLEELQAVAELKVKFKEMRLEQMDDDVGYTKEKIELEKELLRLIMMRC